MISVENVNKVFPNYPITVNDKGWIYGVWYCGTSFNKTKIYGQAPPNYLKRLYALFPGPGIWLHAPSGIIRHGAEGGLFDNGKEHFTVDLVKRGPGCPQILANTAALPFKDGIFDVVETDPPYSSADCQKYGVPKYPRYKAMAEFWRVLKPGGYLAWLDVRYPAYSRGTWKLEGLIAIITGFERQTRLASLFRKLE